MSQDARRLRYLAAMGVQTWRSRELKSSDVNGTDVRLSPEAHIASNDLGPTAQESDMHPGAQLAPLPVGMLGWDDLSAHVSKCTLCALHKGRSQTVFGTGDRRARWLIVGEAPGADEDRLGEPFVGRAGKLLNAMIRAVGADREQLYIANIVKCRPPDNRNPRPDEADCCAPYLQRQIQLLQPKLILAVGRVAANNLLGNETTLGALRGKVHEYAPEGIPLVVTYHPAYLLRKPSDKSKAWDDLRLAMSVAAPLAN